MNNFAISFAKSFANNFTINPVNNFISILAISFVTGVLILSLGVKTLSAQDAEPTTPASAAATNDQLAVASSEQSLLAGQTITWTIPYWRGGGTSQWANFYAPRLAKQLGEKTLIMIDNYVVSSPLDGANKFYTEAEANGLNILGTSASNQILALLRDSRVRYRYQNWRAILATAVGGVVYVSSAVDVNSIEDIFKLRYTPLEYAVEETVSLDIVPLLSFKLLDFNVKANFDYEGRKAGFLAFKRKDLAIDFQPTASYLRRVKPLVDAGLAVPLFTLGLIDANGQVQRDPNFPQLPTFIEVYRQVHGREPSGVVFEAWRAFNVAAFSAQKLIVLPADTPPEIIAEWESAAAETVAALGPSKLLGDYPQSTGAIAQTYLEMASTLSAEAREWVKKWLLQEFGRIIR